MKIAMISTAAVAVPPPGYGGTEQVIHDLTEGLVRAGHDVTLFATGDSHTSAALRFLYPRAVWPVDAIAEADHAAWACAEIAREGWDVVHANHPVCVPLSCFLEPPLVYTLHHDRQERHSALYAHFPAVRYVAISHRQCERETTLRRAAVIHHGVDPARFPFRAEPAGYVAFIGRFAEVKGPHAAIDAARCAGVPIRLAGQPHPGESEIYHAREVAPRLALGGVEWVGEVGGPGKATFLGGARAMLLPITWEEPFGLVSVESMLCGTPVIAFPRGAASEIVEPGVTGFLVHDVEEMAAAIPRAAALDRRRVRARAVERFAAARMVRDYVAVYRAARMRASARGHRAVRDSLVHAARGVGGSGDKRRRRGRQPQPRR